jgi:hypothetical protein
MKSYPRSAKEYAERRTIEELRIIAGDRAIPVEWTLGRACWRELKRREKLESKRSHDTQPTEPHQAR